MDLPVLTIDFKTHPNIADNIFDAQMDGAPKVLTYDGTNPMVRRAAMSFNDSGYSGKVPILKPSPGFLAGAKTDRDEYPFACTREGGSASRIAHVPSGENRSAGALMLAFFKKHGMAKGSHFRVRVVSHQRGEVMRPCRLKCQGCAALCR
ncbi:NucA/NucB deoxyribonuclease domain-containing protein [Bradyrhizobium sp. WSM1417]|uniref:NucA/NucB deoxyribonuclease domain-containing protein n=1 Tax=Bradyrhizobium sp. WSM1417 TaxID=754500 RepID=UPI0004851153|nr:NucA/NucB deoxyribonuclease domain-containing protein [Bradyrhizobium sp. WSM1417]